MNDSEKNLRDGIVKTGNGALNIVTDHLDGTADNSERISQAMNMLRLATKIVHINQIKELTERTQALRILKFIPDEESRQGYIKLTNPQVAPFLLDRPEKSK